MTAAPSFREALLDTRGVIASFESLGIANEDCTPFAREAIDRLDQTLDRVLVGSQGTISPAGRREVQDRVRELMSVSDGCGARTHVLIEDLQVVLGRFLELDQPPRPW